MKSGQKAFIISLFLFIGLAFFRNTARGQTGPATLPLEVQRPQYGEDPHFPRDYVIGELGQGDASEESYALARDIVASLAAGDGKIERAVFPEKKRLAAVNAIKELGVRSWRIGGGRDDGSGCYSFLIRFLGRESSITGELYLQWEQPKPPVVEEEVSAEAVTEPTDVKAETTEETETPEAESAVAETAITKTEPAEPVSVPAETEITEVDLDAPAGEPPTEAAPAEIIAETTVPADEPRWRVDDILLEVPRQLSDGKYSPGGADMTPYERFF